VETSIKKGKDGWKKAMKMNSKKSKRIVSSVICIILVLAMVLPLLASMF